MLLYQSALLTVTYIIMQYINFNESAVYKFNYHPVTLNTFVTITLNFKAVEIFTCQTGHYTL